MDHRAKEAYQELIDVDSKTLPAGIMLNIYTTSEKENGKQYQNLLSAKILNSDGGEHTPKQTVSIKVKKEWEGDNNNHAERPKVRFGLFKDDKMVENTVKELQPGKEEIVYSGIAEDELEHYKVYELDEANKKIENLYKTGDKTYKVTYDYAELKTKNTIKVLNKKVKDIVVKKQWVDKDGKIISAHNYNAIIGVYTQNGGKDNIFNATASTHHYYVDMSDNDIKIAEKCDDKKPVELDEADKNGKEIVIGGKKFIATIIKNALNNYTITNKEKAEKPKEETVTLKVKKLWNNKKMLIIRRHILLCMKMIN